MSLEMRTDTVEAYKTRILRVLIHIQTHLDDPLPLEELADIANFSPYHFHRIFRGMVSESVKEHIRRLRLERAAQRLKQTDQNVIFIALEAGYETHESFTRAFRAMFQASPSEYREAHRVLPPPEAPSGVHFAGGRFSDFEFPRSNDPKPDVRMERVKEMRVAFIRHTGPYSQVGETWGKLVTWAGRQGLIRGRPIMVGIVHDDAEITPDDKLRYDAGIVVDERAAASGEFGIQTIGGGEYGVITHKGPYDKIADSYARMCGVWLPASGRELRAGPGLEFYRNSPQNTAPDNLITDVYMPLSERFY